MEAKKQGEGAEDLSMEDILQSIRKIIADEGGEVDAAAPKDAPVADASASDILELTDMLEEDGTVTNVSSPANAEDVLSSIDAALAPEPVLEPTSEPAPVLVQPAPPPPVVAMPEPAVAPKEMSDEELEALLSKAAEESAISSLNKLKTSDAPPSLLHPPSPAFRSGTTVEDMVAEMLRPMMKEWLDTNLPAIVERIVEREVMRLARR